MLGFLIAFCLVMFVVTSLSSTAKRLRGEDQETLEREKQENIAAYQREQAIDRAMEAAMTLRRDFRPTNFRHGTGLRASIGVDEDSRRICLLDARTGNVLRRIYRHTDLVKVAVVEEGTTITETFSMHAGSLMGMLVGGAVLGGVGATAARYLDTQLGVFKTINTALNLCVTVNDLQHPVWVIPFGDGMYMTDSEEYRTERATVMQWEGLLSILIRQADRELADKQDGGHQPAALSGAASEGYHVCRDGKDIGFMPTKRIRELLAADKLSLDDDLYFDPQLDEWTSLRMLPT